MFRYSKNKVMITFFLQDTPPTFSPDLWNYLIQQAPALGILIYFGWKSLKTQEQTTIWLKEQLKSKDEELLNKDTAIQNLNDYIRTSEKENLELLNDMNSVIDQMVSSVKIHNHKVISELDKKILDLKQHIQDRLATLEKTIEKFK